MAATILLRSGEKPVVLTATDFTNDHEETAESIKGCGSAVENTGVDPRSEEGTWRIVTRTIYHILYFLNILHYIKKKLKKNIVWKLE